MNNHLNINQSLQWLVNIIKQLTYALRKLHRFFFVVYLFRSKIGRPFFNLAWKTLVNDGPSTRREVSTHQVLAVPAPWISPKCLTSGETDLLRIMVRTWSRWLFSCNSLGTMVHNLSAYLRLIINRVLDLGYIDLEHLTTQYLVSPSIKDLNIVSSCWTRRSLHLKRRLNDRPWWNTRFARPSVVWCKAPAVHRVTPWFNHHTNHIIWKHSLLRQLAVLKSLLVMIIRLVG